jgi:hypothetical protein
MSVPSYILKNDALARHQKAVIDLMVDAKGLKFVGAQAQAIIGASATPFTQTAIDALLGSSSEFLATDFGSTALGTDALALILNCDGQIAKVHAVELLSEIDAGAAAIALGLPAAMANTLPSATAPRVAVSSLGNLAVQSVITGLDAGTAAVAVIRIHCELK